MKIIWSKHLHYESISANYQIITKVITKTNSRKWQDILAIDTYVFTTLIDELEIKIPPCGKILRQSKDTSVSDFEKNFLGSIEFFGKLYFGIKSINFDPRPYMHTKEISDLFKTYLFQSKNIKKLL